MLTINSLRRIFSILLVATSVMLFNYGCDESAKDKTPPVITLNGERNVTVYRGQNYDDPGAQATDDRDGEIEVQVNGEVNSSVIGTYKIVYIAVDASGNRSSVVRTVTVVEDPKHMPTYAQVMADAERLFSSSAPYTSDEEYSKTPFGKNKRSREEMNATYHEMNDAIEASDPDPKWYATKADREVIIGQPGEHYTITLSKLDIHGNEYALVDRSKLRLVAARQNDDGSYEKIEPGELSNYVVWSDDHTLDISVPEDLLYGRLLIGVRPNYPDRKQNLLAERVSLLLDIEIWEKKDEGAIEVNDNQILFPVKSDSGFGRDSNFSKEEISSKIKHYLHDKKEYVLPLIVENSSASIGDHLIAHYDHQLYAGTVAESVSRGAQTLLILTPDYRQIYRVPDLNATATVELGLEPKRVLYKFSSSENRNAKAKQLSDFSETKTKSNDSPLDFDCKVGDAFLTFSPSFTLFPFDAGVEFTLKAMSPKTSCTLTAESEPFYVPMKTAGPLAIIRKLLGSRISVQFYGQGSLSTEGLADLGMMGGWSYGKNGYGNLILPYTHYAQLGSLDLSEEPSNIKATLGLSIGAKFKLDILHDGLLSSVYAYLLDDWPESIGLEFDLNTAQAAVINAANASAVDQSGNSSGIAARAGLNATLSISYATQKLLNHFGLKNLNSFSIPVSFFNIHNRVKFSFDKTVDSGTGNASLQNLRLAGPLMPYFVSGISGGVLSKHGSSVYNDKHDSIVYDMDECLKGKIVSPVIGCAGWMCAKVSKNAEMCKDVNITIGGKKTSYECGLVEQGRNFKIGYWAEGCKWTTPQALFDYLNSREGTYPSPPSCEPPKEPIPAPYGPKLGESLDRKVPEGFEQAKETILETKTAPYPGYEGKYSTVYTNIAKPTNGDDTIFCYGMVSSFAWSADVYESRLKEERFERIYTSHRE